MFKVSALGRLFPCQLILVTGKNVIFGTEICDSVCLFVRLLRIPVRVNIDISGVGSSQAKLWKSTKLSKVGLSQTIWNLLSPCPVVTCPVVTCPVISCPVVSCPVVSCPVIFILLSLSCCFIKMGKPLQSFLKYIIQIPKQ